MLSDSFLNTNLIDRLERLLAADDLLRRVREELHTDLVFSRAGNGRLLFDFSALELPFPAPEKLRIPKRCPVDFSAFRVLSEHYREAKGRDRILLWTYRWFYLEILSVEGKLKPRLWAKWEAVEAGLPLVGVTIDPREPMERVSEQARQWWSEHSEEMFARRLAFEHVDRPWLDYLEFDPYLMQPREESPIAPITMSAFPIYLWPEDGATLVREMRNELFRTSIFYPEKSTEMREIKFQKLRDRFAMKLRREEWGGLSGRRAEIRARDAEIYEQYRRGRPKYRIAQEYGINVRSVYDAIARYERTLGEKQCGE